jgi:hypothetical protein
MIKISENTLLTLCVPLAHNTNRLDSLSFFLFHPHRITNLQILAYHSYRTLVLITGITF